MADPMSGRAAASSWRTQNDTGEISSSEVDSLVSRHARGGPSHGASQSWMPEETARSKADSITNTNGHRWENARTLPGHSRIAEIERRVLDLNARRFHLSSSVGRAKSDHSEADQLSLVDVDSIINGLTPEAKERPTKTC